MWSVPSGLRRPMSASAISTPCLLSSVVRELERTRSDRRNDVRHHYRSAPARESVAAMDGRRARQRVWPEWFDGDVAAPPPLDIAAVIAYCEQRVPPHALYAGANGGSRRPARCDAHRASSAVAARVRARVDEKPGRPASLERKPARVDALSGVTATTAGTATNTRRRRPGSSGDDQRYRAFRTNSP
jgi:hypothetical protein